MFPCKLSCLMVLSLHLCLSKGERHHLSSVSCTLPDKECSTPDHPWLRHTQTEEPPLPTSSLSVSPPTAPLLLGNAGTIPLHSQHSPASPSNTLWAISGLFTFPDFLISHIQILNGTSTELWGTSLLDCTAKLTKNEDEYSCVCLCKHM